MATLFLADFPPPSLNVARSPRAVRLITAVSRTLDSTKQRARPFQIADLYVFCSRLPAYYSPVLAKLARVIALVAFSLCLGLFCGTNLLCCVLFHVAIFYFDAPPFCLFF